GSKTTSSPAPTVPETSLPVTTDPNPFIANARSIVKRKYPDPSRIATLDAAWRKAFFKSSSPARVLALTAIIGASSRNDPRKYSWASSRTNSSVSVSTRSLLVSATTPRLTPSRRQISKCSRVCGLMDSSAATTSSSTSIPAAPASMLLTNRSCPGTSTKPNRTPFSSRKAKPKSIVIPRSFSSARRSGCVPVSASTSVDLPWSMRSEEHTSELQSLAYLVCRLLLDTATTHIYTLSLHDALPISRQHVADEPFVPRHIHETESDSIFFQKSKTQINRDSAEFLFSQTIWMRAGQRFDQRRFAVVDEIGRAHV